MAAERDWNEKPFELHPHGVGLLRIPVIPPAEVLKEAAQKAFVALPEGCARSCALAANFEDNDGMGPVHWLGRATDLANSSWSMRGSMRGRQSCVESCDLQWVILCHGSGGLTYTNWRYAAKLVALGYGVLAPDSMAAARQLHLRHKDPVVLKKAQTSHRHVLGPSQHDILQYQQSLV